MPELPEVETVVRELRTRLPGKTISKYTVFWSKTFVNKSSFDLEGQKIRFIGRKGKYIIFQLDHSSMIIHLRMTGQLRFLSDDNRTLPEHIRFRLHFADGSYLLFNDPRKFGRIYHLNDEKFLLDKVGIDALDQNFTCELFIEMARRHQMNIKAFLLSQKFVSGLGNIYVDESLFRAGIHPASICNRIPAGRLERLYSDINEVLRFAVRNMGSTISDYRDAYGNPGKNQLFFRVYQRENLPCSNCATPIEKIRVAGRGTRICKVCQKLYR